MLWQLIGDTWTAADVPWPAGVSFQMPDQISMTIINENPTLAVNTGDAFIQLLQYSHTAKRWEKLREGRLEAKPSPPQWFKVLNFADQPAVWVWADTTGGQGEIWTPNRSIKLPEIKGIEVGDADVTVAGDQIWLVYRNNQGKLFQQRFNLDGSAPEQPSAVVSKRPPSMNSHSDWITIGVMTMLMFLILSALLRRRAAASKDAGDENEGDDNT